jgi:hypothetical protein
MPDPRPGLRLRQIITTNWRALGFVLGNRPAFFLGLLIRSMARRLRGWGSGDVYIAWADCGFFANVRAISLLLLKAHEEGKRPVVVSSRYAVKRAGATMTIGRNLYWSDAGWNGARNTWEYYFEPVAGPPVNEEVIGRRQADIEYASQFVEQDPAVIREHTRYGYRTEAWAHLHGRRDYPTRDDRVRMHEVLHRFVRVKPSIMAKANAFYDRHMAGKRVVGVHIRKGDFERTEGVPTQIHDYIAIVERQAGWEAVYVATDCEATLQSMLAFYGERLVSYPCTRASNDEGIHNSFAAGLCKPLLGEEVLIEALLLARCGLFVHANSSMNHFVLSWNPDLEHVSVFPKHVSEADGALNRLHGGGVHRLTSVGFG